MGVPVRLDHASDIARGANNFDLLRLAAAILVLFNHSFDLTATVVPLPSLVNRTNIGWSTVGVLIFFAISGFLIARSWTYDPRVLAFAVKRGLRLLPALVVSLLVTALVLGPLVTTLPVSTYLETPATKWYVLQNSILWTDYSLPGVFATNTYPDAVNGSLWTLPVEVKAYVLVAVIGMLGIFRRAPMIVVGIALIWCLWTIDVFRNNMPLGNRAVASLVDIQTNSGTVGRAWAGEFNDWLKVFTVFTIGMALFSIRRWVWLRWDLVGLAALIWGATIAIGPDASWHAFVFLLPYVLLVVAYRTTQWVRLPPRFGDYSYGIYIIAFPVQQFMSQVFSPSSGWLMFALALPVTVALAVLSWHFVEAPALTLKKYLVLPEEHPTLSREALDPVKLG